MSIYLKVQRKKTNLHGARASHRGKFHSIITILVGPDEVAFLVHDMLLCAHSAFFQAACQGAGQFKETQERIVRLPEEDPAQFEEVIQWLYTQSLQHVTDGLGNPTSGEVEEIDAEQEPPQDPQAASTSPPSSDEERRTNASYATLFNLYFLADRLQMGRLKNGLMDAIIQLERRSAFVPCSEQVALVFERCPAPTNPLRRLLVDMHAWDVEPAFIRDNQTFFTKDFLLELACVAMAFCERSDKRSKSTTTTTTSTSTTGGAGGSSSNRGGAGGPDLERPYVVAPESYHEKL